MVWLPDAKQMPNNNVLVSIQRLTLYIISPTLFRFIPGPWSPCSATCGPGRQTRVVKCQVLLSFTKTEVDLPEEECGKDRPQLERPCNQGTCNKVPGISSGLEDYGTPYIETEKQYSWDYRDFTVCSATCAAGELSEIDAGSSNAVDTFFHTCCLLMSNLFLSMSSAQGSRQLLWGVLTGSEVRK